MAIQILEKLQNEEHNVTKHYALLIIIKKRKGDSQILSVRHVVGKEEQMFISFLVKSWYHVRQVM